MLLADLSKKNEVTELAKLCPGIQRANELAITFFGRPGARSPFIASLSEEERQTLGTGDQDVEQTVVTVLIPYFVESVRIPRTIDLRIPRVQEWFFNTFGAKDTEFYKKIDRGGASSFKDILAYLFWPDHGGNHFTNSVGRWFRTHGVAALLYPSARSNCRVTVRSGVITDSYGWNLVDYRNAPFPTSGIDGFTDIIPGWRSNFGPEFHVLLATDADQLGSWQVTGVEEWYQAILNGREQQFLESALKPTTR